jgi:hypothetical protein
MSIAYLLQGGTLIDGTGAEPRPNDDLLVCEGHIAGMGEIARRKATKHQDAIVIDCTGHTIMPGLVDGHVHLTFDEAASTNEFLYQRRQSFGAIVAAWNAQKLLRAGVTSCLDADSLWSTGVAVRDAIEAGVAEGPRLVAGGEALIPYPDPLGSDVFGPSRAPAHHRAVRGRDEMITEIRRMAANGVNWIKILASAPIPGQPGEQPVDVRRAADGLRHGPSARTAGRGALPAPDGHQRCRASRRRRHRPRLVHGRARARGGARSATGDHADVHVPRELRRLRRSRGCAGAAR